MWGPPREDDGVLTYTYVPPSGPTKADPFLYLSLFLSLFVSATRSDVTQDARLFRVDGKAGRGSPCVRARRIIFFTCSRFTTDDWRTFFFRSVAEMSCCSLAAGSCRNVCSKVCILNKLNSPLAVTRILLSRNLVKVFWSRLVPSPWIKSIRVYRCIGKCRVRLFIDLQ